jgi:dolichol kinase
MNKEIINTGILAALFLLLFLIAEFLYHKLKVKAHLTRNIVHFGTGMLTLLFPVMLANHWLVLFLCAGFAIILIISVKFNSLKSINSIDRISYGSILYPIAVYGCYLVYDYFGKELLFFYLPVLTLAICDPIAALFGKRWPYGNFRIGNDTKTVMGSLAFFISSVAVTLILFYFLSTKNLNDVLPVTLLIAATSSVTEVLSVKGIDNITIPASVVLILTLFR